MTAKEIQARLKGFGSFYEVYIPEFTYGGRRIDAAFVDTRHRWVRGFEIKVTRTDFLSDKKWTEYTEFCSSLSIVCPAELIQKDEIKKPFGLLWIYPDKIKWIKRPTNFQKKDSLAWLYTYVRVIEKELPRLAHFK